MKQTAHAGGRGFVWSLLFLLLLASLAGMGAMLISGTPLYAILFLPSGVLASLALRKWEES